MAATKVKGWFKAIPEYRHKCKHSDW